MNDSVYIGVSAVLKELSNRLDFEVKYWRVNYLVCVKNIFGEQKKVGHYRVFTEDHLRVLENILRKKLA